jgi:hypothetical protein
MCFHIIKIIKLFKKLKFFYAFNFIFTFKLFINYIDKAFYKIILI